MTEEEIYFEWVKSNLMHDACWVMLETVTSCNDKFADKRSDVIELFTYKNKVHYHPILNHEIIE